MTACAPCSLAATSETIACFCSRLRPKVYLLTVIRRPGIRNAVCVGDNTIKPGSCPDWAPTVFDDNCCQSHCCAESDAGSTLTPGPIVLDTETFFRKIPLVAAGFALFSASTRAGGVSRRGAGADAARRGVHGADAV